jgi:hypothetical protein
MGWDLWYWDFKKSHPLPKNVTGIAPQKSALLMLEMQNFNFNLMKVYDDVRTERERERVGNVPPEKVNKKVGKSIVFD